MDGVQIPKPVLIRSELFSRFHHVRLYISTRVGGVSPGLLGLNLSYNVGDDPENVHENRRRFFEYAGIPIDSVVTQQQVHGDTIRHVTEPGRIPACDALMTNAQRIFLAVSIADCLPVFLFDPDTNSLAAIHSGWRGSTLKILEQAIMALREQYNATTERMVAYLGPSASVCCYEVGEEVAAKFDKKYLQQTAARKPHLDLKQFNRDLLLEAGLLEKNIEVSEYCTICHPELFHSYRRDNDKSGRMMGVVGIVK